MKWAEAKGERERIALLEWAATVTPQKVAAAALGISRRHLVRMLKETRETQSLNETSRLSNAASGDETPTDDGSLTYGRVEPHIATMQTETPEAVSMTIDLPRDCAEWVEEQAVKLRHETGASRIAKSPVMARLVREAMAREKDSK